MTKDGKPYAPYRYRQIAEECYYISENINTSYLDLMKVTPLERKYFVDILNKRAEKIQQANDEAKARINKAKSKR